MTKPPQPPAPSVGRFTGLVLGFVVFICITMIGFAGYLKNELDRAEAVLAAPEVVLSPDQEAFEKLRRDLGFGGFVGLAQNFASTHDAAALPDMKAQLKSADDMMEHLPEKTPAEVRHDLQAIVATFDAAMQRAEKAATDPATSFTPADMAPLYAALPVLDSRVVGADAAIRFAAQSRLQFWSMLLTLVSWASLIIASALAAGIYLTLRDRNSAPLRALSQSVKNMARGDMRTSIWGMERQDMVGELARAVDMARYQFSQVPDMSVMSEQGPVRLRFEGNTRSLFEAMMRVISRDSEQVHVQAAALTEAINRQQEAIALISSRVEAIMQNAEKRTLTGDQQTQKALQTILTSAQELQHAQEHAADQLNRIVPYLQERAHGLAEITQITGKQVAQVLQSLITTERGLKVSAEQSEGTIKKFSTAADDLGERMFGAINLLQASGKVLAEMTESTQSRLNEAIERLGKNVQAAGGAVPYPSPDASGAAPRMETVAEALETTQKKLEVLLTEQTQATKAQIDLLTIHSAGLLSQNTTASQTLASAADHMRDDQTKLDEAFNHYAAKLDEIGSRIESQVAEAIGKTGSATDQSPLKELAAQIDTLSGKLTALGQGFGAAQTKVETPSDLSEQIRDQWFQMAAQLEATRTGLAQIITQQIDRIDTRLADLHAPEAAAEPAAARNTQQQMEQQTQILTELVATLGVLDAHMQEIRSQVAAGAR